jgi:heme exporter protein B
MNNFFNLLRHEIRLQVRQKTEWASLLLFFAIVIILMPFALGPEPEILRRLAPGLIWLAALLMGLMSLDRLFVQDARDGTLDQMLTSPSPLEVIVFAKILAQTLVVLAALVIMTPIAALLLGLDSAVLPTLIGTFVLGVPSLAFLGGIAGAVTVALNRNAALLTLLLIPFYIPILIFAVSACDAATTGVGACQPLLFLAAILTLILPASPFIIAASLRHGQG